MTDDDNSKEAFGPADGEFINNDGLQIYCKYWYPETRKIRALVLAIHGLGEHVGRYDDIAASFTKLGCLVFGHDHVGHGRSQGMRVDIESFEKYVQDCFQHVEIMTKEHPDIPVMIYGHSMGGAIAILTMNAAPDRFIGAIFGSPAARVDPSQATSLRISVGRMVAYLCPQAPIARLNVSNISRDPAVVEAYNKDPLVWHGGVKARFALQLLNTCQRIEAEYEKVTYPFLLQHGTKDELCDITGSDMFFEKAPSHNKTYKRYNGYFHELVREPEGEREVVFKDIEDWTEKLLSSRDNSNINSRDIDVKC